MFPGPATNVCSASQGPLLPLVRETGDNLTSHVVLNATVQQTVPCIATHINVKAYYKFVVVHKTSVIETASLKCCKIFTMRRLNESLALRLYRVVFTIRMQGIWKTTPAHKDKVLYPYAVTSRVNVVLITSPAQVSYT